MKNNRLSYTELFISCVDFVSSGRKGAISDEISLQVHYDPTYLDILLNQLKNPNPRVRKEVVLLLTKLKERGAEDAVAELSDDNSDSVRSACQSYFQKLNEDNDAVPGLIDIMRHRNGDEFIRAAIKLKAIARKEDIDDIREIFGQVDGEMKAAVKDVLTAIVGRNPDLDDERYLIMSQPVFPDQKKFMRFADECIVYLDIRYRDNVYPKSTITGKVYGNVIESLKKIHIRLYNEKANLRYYDRDARKCHQDATELFEWAAEDIRTKKIGGTGGIADAYRCPNCKVMMVMNENIWICPKCGTEK